MACRLKPAPPAPRPAAGQQKRVFDNRTVTVDALMAASAVPGLFPPVEVDGALEADPTQGRAVVVLSYAQAERSPEPTTMRRALEASFELVMVHQIRRDTELARFRAPNVGVQLLTPSAPMLLRPLAFDRDAMTRLFALGRADAPRHASRRGRGSRPGPARGLRSDCRT